MKKVKHIMVFSISVLVAGLLLGFAVDRSSSAMCTGFQVEIEGDATLRFVTEQSISSFILEHGHVVENRQMKEIDTYGIEEDLRTIPFIEAATVYKTIDQGVHIHVVQRKPVMRLFTSDGFSTYVDDKGNLLQTSPTFSYKCLPVTGLRPLTEEVVAAGSIHSDASLMDLWNMARFIGADEFWNSQIIQIENSKENGFVMVPRVGNHEVIFGGLEDYSSKLIKLKEFYDRGINQTNWNKYKSLDLRYDKQVVGVKR